MAKFSFSNLQRATAPGLVLVIGLVVSFTIFNGLLENNRDKLEERFREAALERLAAVEKRISSELTVLRSIVGFYQGSNFVDYEEFRSFIDTVLTSGRSFQALEWIPRIPDALRQDYEQKAHENGFKNFFIKEKSPDGKMIPAGPRDEYFPVYYVEPYVGNEGAHGFDLASNKTRLAALEQARDSGAMVASSRISLVQLKENNAGVLIFAPIFGKSKPHETIVERRQNLAGFALGVIRVSGLITGVFSDNNKQGVSRPAGIDLHVYEEDGNQGHVALYTHSSRLRQDKAPRLSIAQARLGYSVEQPFTVGGRIWTIIAKPVDPDFSGAIPVQSWFALIASLLITGMICVYVISINHRTRIVEQMVRQRTAELKDATQVALDRESRISAVLETIVDGIVTIDEQAKIEGINQATEKLFGYSNDELIGANLGLLMAEPYRSMHESYVKKYQHTKFTSIIGRTQEIVGVRKDATTFPMELAIGDMKIGGKTMFTGIVRDITDRKQAEKIKTDFVSTVSHELITPLTSIKGALGLIRSNATEEIPDKLKSMFDIAYSNSDRLVRLINDILDIEKISAGKMEFQMVTLDLVDLLEQAMEANKGYGDENNVRFSLTMEVANAKIYGDPDRLMQVLANLLSNAAKFSPEGDSVKITLSRDGQKQRVHVIDNGPGIPEEFHDKIFERFSQADSSDTRQKGGTGLGLNISRSIIEAHGGHIGFETQTGKGSTFFFELPVMAGVADHWGEGLDASEQPRVLICEDESDIATLLELMLKQDGYLTDTARSAAQASSLAQTNEYAAMTLDIGLPDRDGISLIRELRENPKTRDLPIIVVSAMTSDNAKNLNGDAVGIIDWIEKPIDIERLSVQLHRALSNTRNGKPRILHVEDDPDIIRIVAELVGDFASITPAMTLADAKSSLTETTYDLVILDLILPDGVGDDILPMLNKNTSRPTPVIVFSAKDLSKQGSEQFKASLIKSQTTNEKLLGTIRSVIESGQQADSGL